MRRSLAVSTAVVAAALVATLLLGAETTSASAATEPPVAPAKVEWITFEAPPPADKAHARIKRRQARLGDSIAELVESGVVTADEGAQLERISRGTLAEAEVLVQRVRDGEIHWVGAFVRGVPLRIQHVSQVVNVIGYERTAAIGRQRRN